VRPQTHLPPSIHSGALPAARASPESRRCGIGIPLPSQPVARVGEFQLPSVALTVAGVGNVAPPPPPLMAPDLC